MPELFMFKESASGREWPGATIDIRQMSAVSDLVKKLSPRPDYSHRHYEPRAGSELYKVYSGNTNRCLFSPINYMRRKLNEITLSLG